MNNTKPELVLLREMLTQVNFPTVQSKLIAAQLQQKVENDLKIMQAEDEEED